MRASVLFRLKQAPERAVRTYAQIYFAVQAVAVLVWWIALSIFPAWRLYFFPSHVLDGGLGGWFITDIATVVIPSVEVAVFGHSKSRLGVVAALIALCGLMYASVCCAAWALRDGLFVPAIMMIPLVAGSVVATFFVAKRP